MKVRALFVSADSAAAALDQPRTGFGRGACQLVLCIALGIAALACGEEPVEQESVARPVKVLELGAGASAARLEYPGEISAAQHSEMAFEVPGKIIEFPVMEGQQVEKGTLLARLDPRDFDAELGKARANVAQAKSDYERYKTLYEQGVEAQATLEAKQRRYEVTLADMETTQKAVEDTRLVAPFAGRVARKLVKDFQNVNAKEAVLILQDDSSLEIVVNVPERDLTVGRREGTPEEASRRLAPVVTVTSIPDRSFPARAKEIATTADPVTRTFQATFAFASPADVNILPGMTAKVSINRPGSRGPSRGFSIPARATLADESGGATVWVVDPDSMTVRRAKVELGEMSGAEVEVRSGLSSGDLIAISGVHQLREGMPVRRLEP
jgi:RND family efflux transporter MFP subunit